ATLTAGKAKLKETFSFRDTPGKHFDVLLNSKPVTRYMCERDTSDDKTKHNTYKVYNHVFDEAGEKFLTKGPGGKFTHHRGIFIGFSRTSANGKRYDTWHMKNVTQTHQKFAGQAAGPVLAKYTALINWNEGEDKPIISEQREITVYNQGDSAILLLDFHTKLTAAAGDVVLDGDPEHAGCQYRPHDDVSKNKSAKYMFHKDGLNLKKDKDLPWAALTYKLNDKQYHVQYLAHPSIPKGNTYSAYRDYGRFGAYFKKQIAKGETLELRYRFYVAKGDMPDRKEMEQRYTAFVTPPKAEVFKE
ncbi:MAG: PmoA family protein, partial [Planctomycetes bacterium]|nr:PmoA family protein [Planctomycetota bacterium]